MTSKKLEKIKKQALLLAQENKRTESDITKIFWFPDEQEVRLIELEDNFICSASGAVEPFYFPPSPQDGLPSPSGVAIIRTDEFKRLKLPDEWGGWDKAEEIKIEK